MTNLARRFSFGELTELLNIGNLSVYDRYTMLYERHTEDKESWSRREMERGR